MKNDKIPVDWKPCASHSGLRVRAAILSKIRQFFSSKDVLEVDTPTLSQGTITDINLEAMISHCSNLGNGLQTLYLQTSPEYAMKRLLASGSGCIYQICRGFRDDELGHLHNPEFLMLEWYRVGFDHHQLMSEMDELLSLLLGTDSADKITYQQLFLEFLQIDPLVASTVVLQQLVTEKVNGLILENRDQMLQCLFSTVIEPYIASNRPLMVFDYPASQSALARISPNDPRVAERFEVYYRGIELANGFHELTNAREQRQRFTEDNKQRKWLGKAQRPFDENLLSALESGLPDCAGVAMGLDRLLMLLLDKQSISEVMAFPIDRA